MTTFKISFAVTIASLAASVCADVISINPTAAIVNIDSTKSGSGGSGPGSGNGDKAVWTGPFNAVQYTVSATGLYNFRVIDSTDAGKLFPTLSSSQRAEINGSWTYNSPWITNYLVYDDATLKANPNAGELIYGARSTDNESSSAAAYQDAISMGYYNTFYIGGPNPADINNTSTAVTAILLTAGQTLDFVIPDFTVSDNTGTLSVLVSEQSTAAPLPTSALGAGIILMALALRSGWPRSRRSGMAIH